MTAVAALISLGMLDPVFAAEYLGVDVDSREPVGSYGSLHDLDVIESPSRPGIRFYLHADAVVMVYIGPSAHPEGLSDEILRVELDEPDTERLRSRQGKRGRMSVAAERGIAWSSMDGTVGWIELFAPRSFEQYRTEIYATPPKFIQ